MNEWENHRFLGQCVHLVPEGPYTLTSFLVPVAGASQLAPVNWRVCHATGTRISLVPVTDNSRF